MNNIEKLKTTGLFTNYIYKAIPLAFDESMSYYETLCGLLAYLKDTVIPTVNNNADAVIELQNLYTQLKEYVDNYFDNLDVQEEINNKLDAMAEDGTLTQIISSYVNPFIQEQNQNIEHFENNVNSNITAIETLVNSVASGSPLVASSTEGMTNTDRIYVNTTDGKWYYYNGSEWTIGGTYQSTGIAEDSITYFNLDDTLKNELHLSFDTMNVIFERGNISDTTGQNTGASSTTTLIRTKDFIKGNYIVINAETDYRYKVYRYQADGTFIDVSSSRLSGQTIITNTGNYKYRLACSKTDWSEMEVSESSNYTFKKINNNFYNDYIEFKKNNSININDILLSQYDNKLLNIAYSGIGLAPTNSLEHFMIACNMGFNSLKGDIRLTSDNKLIMCHDAGFTLNNDNEIISFDNSNYTSIHSLTYNQCMALSYNAFKSRAGHNCHVCDIDHYLQICKKYDKIPYITIRNEYLDDTITALIQKLKFYK